MSRGACECLGVPSPGTLRALSWASTWVSPRVSTHPFPHPLPPPPHQALMGPEQSREGGRKGGTLRAVHALALNLVREGFGGRRCHSPACPPASPEIPSLPPSPGEPTVLVLGVDRDSCPPRQCGEQKLGTKQNVSCVQVSLTELQEDVGMPSGGREGPMEEVGRMLREKEGKRGHSRERTAWAVARRTGPDTFLWGRGGTCGHMLRGAG